MSYQQGQGSALDGCLTIAHQERAGGVVPCFVGPVRTSVVVMGRSRKSLEEEQTLSARLAVFTGGGTLDAMGAVCTSVEGKEVDAQRTFAALCAHSLVRQIEDPALGARF